MANSTLTTRCYGIQRGEPAWFATVRVAERHLGVLLAILFVPIT